jgi:hypothetical protein
MIHTEYCTITELGREFGLTRVVMGRVLKELGLRELHGHPSQFAFSNEMVRKSEGPKPWIVVWLWDTEKTMVSAGTQNQPGWAK